MKVYFLIYSSSSRWLQGEEWRYNNSEMRAYQHTSMWHNTIIPLRNAADMSERWILNKLPYLQYHSHYTYLFFALNFFSISFSCFPVFLAVRNKTILKVCTLVPTLWSPLLCEKLWQVNVCFLLITRFLSVACLSETV